MKINRKGNFIIIFLILLLIPFSANSHVLHYQNLNYIKSDVMVVNNPAEYHLPQQNVSTKYLFAKEDMYFVYQNNYNQFVQYFKDTFQHGGISLEEMLIPVITLEAK